MIRSFLVVLLSLVSPACGSPSAPEGSLRVLFIGNSLTAYNNLPAMVAALGRLGGPTVQVASALMDGSSLEDHWQSGPARTRVAEGWDFVVMQQGPSSLAESAVHLRTWAMEWATVIRAAGGEPALFAVWPDESRASFFPDVSANYRAAAEAVDGRFLPAGDAWLAAWAEDAGLGLYGPDRFHPSPLGSLLAALTIYAGLTGYMPELPARFEVGDSDLALSEPLRGLLVRAATAALGGAP